MLKPLPAAQEPITGKMTPTQRYVEYLQSLDKSLRFPPLPNVQTANYTLAATDAAGIVEMNLAGANTLTVPLNNAVPIAIGAKFKITQIGAGATTITAAVGVTIRNRSGLILAGQYAVAELYKRGTDEWVASGDLA